VTASAPRMLPSVRSVEHEMREVLTHLALTSVTRARVYVGTISSSSRTSLPPTGESSPAAAWCERFNAAAPVDRQAVLAGARDELANIRRRRFPLTTVRDGDDLRERIVHDGEGLDALEVAIALRCTPTMVRRTRLVHGRDAERGKHVTLLALEPRALLAAGMSIRTAAAVTGVARSTLHDHVRGDEVN
jgi:hypothetical protein